MRKGCGQSDFLVLEPFLDHIFRARFDHFWSHFSPPYSLQFRPLLVAILDPILGPHRPNSGARIDKERDQALKLSKKRSFQNLKNPQFLQVFGTRSLPREPQGTQKASQELPK